MFDVKRLTRNFQVILESRQGEVCNDIFIKYDVFDQKVPEMYLTGRPSPELIIRMVTLKLIVTICVAVTVCAAAVSSIQTGLTILKQDSTDTWTPPCINLRAIEFCFTTDCEL